MVLSSAIVCDRDCRIADIAEVCFPKIADDHRHGTRDEPLKTSAWEAIGTLGTPGKKLS